MADFDSKARPQVEALLEPGEQLEGIVAANHQGMFKGRLVAIGVTDRRLIILGLDRKIQPKGEPLAIAPDQIASAKAGGAGGGWGEPTSAVMDKAAAELKLKTTDGEKLKLMMMRGTGPGPLAALGGGEAQADGVAALARWFEGIDPRTASSAASLARWSSSG
ncbi:MAG: hypothetical protein ACXWF9_06080 [Solirubrobacterales bacterium]